MKKKSWIYRFNFRTGLKFSAIFAPLVAVFVGLVLFMRPETGTRLEIRLRLMREAVQEVMEMDAVSRRYLITQEPFVKEDWERTHVTLSQVLAIQTTENAAEKTILDNMVRKQGALKEVFTRLSQMSDRGGESSTAQRARLEEDLQRLSKGIISDAVDMVEMSYRTMASGQQRFDTFVILFSAAIALVFAIFAYLTVRGEILNRQSMSRELEQSNILLSDAFVRLRRAEHGVQQERMQVVRDMIQGVTHEVHANLIPIVRATETLLNFQEHLDDRVRLTTALQTIGQNAKMAKATLDRFTKVGEESRKDILPKAVNLNRIVEDGLLYCQAQITANAQRGMAIRVVKEFKEVPLIDGSESDLREVVAYIIQNATEAMTRGGVLTLRTLLMPPDRVAFVVEDTGKGMSEGVRRHCCEPFFSTKENSSAGLGLTIVSATVRRHNGQLDIQSQVGKGTQLMVILPIRQARLPSKEAVLPAVPAKAWSILVVDDEPWVGETIRDLLLSEGHAVQVVTGAEQALSLCRTTRFDLVVTDRAMPGMDGEKLAGMIKRQSPNVRIMLLTGLGEMIRDAGVTSSVVNAVVSKPITLERLIEAVQKVMRDYTPA